MRIRVGTVTRGPTASRTDAEGGPTAWKAWVYIGALGIVGALGLAFWQGPKRVASALNPVLYPAPDLARRATPDLHGTLLVADLHSDALLWDRDLLRRSDRGHVDLPRLREGRSDTSTCRAWCRGRSPSRPSRS